jgi:hypothetical protein
MEDLEMITLLTTPFELYSQECKAAGSSTNYNNSERIKKAVCEIGFNVGVL